MEKESTIHNYSLSLLQIHAFIMNKFFCTFALLAIVAVGAHAQGAGLSQGQAYVAPTPTPKQTKKTCPECGITKGNITYPWQHHTWCPYYRAQSSGSSGGSRGFNVPSTKYGLASGLTSMLGQALVSSLFSNPDQGKSPEQIQTEREAARAQAEARRKKYEEIAEDTNTWRWGNYQVMLENKKPKVYYGIYNTKTKQWVHKSTDYTNTTKQLDNPIVARGVGWVITGSGDMVKGDKFDRICFFDSKKEGTAPELDGLVWFNAEAKYSTKGEANRNAYFAFRPACGILKIENEQLVKVLWSGNLNRKFTNFVAIGSMPFFRGVPREQSVGYSLFNKEGKLLAENLSVCKAWGNKYLCIQSRTDNTWSLLNRDAQYIERGAKEITTFENKPYMNVCRSDGKNLVYGNEGPIFEEYEDVTFCNQESVENERSRGSINQGKKDYLLVRQGNHWGALGTSGEVLIDLGLKDKDAIQYQMQNYDKTYSYQLRRDIEKAMTTKDMFETTEAFKARQASEELQQKYIATKTEEMEEEYLRTSLKNGITLQIKDYDADKGVYTIEFKHALTGQFPLEVPLEEAKNFMKVFAQIKETALDNSLVAVYGDCLAIVGIAFKTPDGKTYSYVNTDVEHIGQTFAYKDIKP